jgi:hypothetical protein
MTTDGVVKAAREAARISRAAKSVQKRPVELGTTPVVKGTWMTPVTRDPIDVPIEGKGRPALRDERSRAQGAGAFAS